MLRRVLAILRSETGFSMIGILVAVAITGVISVGITTGIVHMVNIGRTNGNYTLATKSIQNAVYWFRVDAKMAQMIELDSGDSGLPVTLGWVEWDSSEHSVSYAVDGDRLTRSYSVDGSDPITMLVTAFVDSDSAMTNCQFTDGILIYKMSVAVGEGRSAVTMTDTISIDPRSD